MKSYTFYLLFILLYPSLSFAEQLTLNSFLEQLEDRHPRIKGLEENKRISEAAKRREEGTKDWEVAAGTSYRYDEPAQIGIAVPDNTEKILTEAEVRKKLWSTGGNLSARYFNNYENTEVREFSGAGFDSSSFFPEDFYQNGVLLSYTQPLLKNRGGTLDNLAYELKGFDEKISLARSQESSELFLLESGLLFIQWAELEAKKNILKERLALAKKQFKETKDMASAGVKEDVDLFQAEESIWLSQQNLNLTESNSKAIRAQIANLLQKDNENLSVSYNLGSKLKNPQLASIIQEIKNNSRSLKLVKIEKDRAERELEGIDDQKNHQLDLELSAGLTSGEEDSSDSFDLDKSNALVGLRYTRALGQTTNDADLDRITSRLEQLKHEYDDQFLILSSAAKSLIKRINGLEGVIDANLKQLDSAIKRTKGEDKIYKQGRRELNFVIQSQDSEQAARFQLVENRALYHSLHLQLKELTDSLLSKN